MVVRIFFFYILIFLHCGNEYKIYLHYGNDISIFFLSLCKWELYIFCIKLLKTKFICITVMKTRFFALKFFFFNSHHCSKEDSLHFKIVVTMLLKKIWKDFFHSSYKNKIYLYW